jgi:hypothetical protein
MHPYGVGHFYLQDPVSHPNRFGHFGYCLPHHPFPGIYDLLFLNPLLQAYPAETIFQDLPQPMRGHPLSPLPLLSSLASKNKPNMPDRFPVERNIHPNQIDPSLESREFSNLFSAGS